MRSNLAGLNLNKVTVDALLNGQLGSPFNLSKIIIHTEGATSQGPAAWANIELIVDIDGRMWFPWYRAGKVSIDPSAPVHWCPKEFVLGS